ncbi:MAG TPA: PDDEXK nuclease domain-containing protein [Methanocorpusculum sp.]|nr:PDDEXK nuclease domain-containing protein [Methanocorpusculum sp.]HJJ40486.1 PDDEXK nuclease domain-containing protein [Methanocorpusculum sp.]HJJ49799.1 PDDEXK nuclease domain-containing protein [Methanocorpusculum sp.]HJJ57364.1 PDDEXK nuclease domain-containing protein [Methanocorpusculum sp.]
MAADITDEYESVVNDIRGIITHGRETAYRSAHAAILMTYWSVGKRIIEQEQDGKHRAEYGKRLLSTLSERLTAEFGSGYTARNLRNFRQFYLFFPDSEIWHACVPNLTWTHIRSLLRVEDETARLWYLQEANRENWSSRTLDRNIATQYYYRLLKAPEKEEVIAEMHGKTAQLQESASTYIKSPVVAEFLGFKRQDSYLESDLENAILTHLGEFILEMGRGFAFVSRQQHIITDTEDYYIDLVFYNIELKCYVLIDLKMGKITHQDVGQIDMYVRMYDELKRHEGDNPTIGILLCSETSEDIARFSVLHDNNRLFMSKYLTYLPTKEQLKQEIERQKEIFYLQHQEDDEQEDGDWVK